MELSDTRGTPPADAPDVLLVDDGELRSAREQLDALGVSYAVLEGSKAQSPIAYPERLLITTAALAVSLRCRKELDRRGTHATWIAFVDHGSRTQRAALRQAGFNFQVSEPVHASALRCLLLRALYSGSEHRRVPRVAFGYDVHYRGRLWPRRATLADLSPRGARILTREELREGVPITLTLPREVAGGKVLRLPARVVRTAPGPNEGGERAEVSVGLRFGQLDAERRSRLKRVLIERVTGPAVLPGATRSARKSTEAEPEPMSARVAPSVPEQRTSPAAEMPAAAAPQPKALARPMSEDGHASEQRRAPRACYSRQVPALVGDHALVLLGSDLSAGGMRIEPCETLAVGHRVRLALHGRGREEPFLVEARVVRDDGERGMGLQFDWIEPEAESKLCALIDGLPAIDPLVDDDPTFGRVIVQLLPNGGEPEAG